MTEVDSTHLEQEVQAPTYDVPAMLEALIFVSKEPLSVERMIEAISAHIGDIDARVVKRALKELVTKWQDPHRVVGRGFFLCEIAQGYAFMSSPEHALIVKKMVDEKPLELSKGQLEVLAIVAYRQPITRIDVDEIRGVDGSFALRRLLDLKLVKILGKSEGLGRPLLYGTTKRFLEFFTLNSLNDLPSLKQIEALGKEDPSTTADLTSGQVSLTDLLADRNQGAMFSAETQALSDEALKSLDDALLKIDGMRKIPSN